MKKFFLAFVGICFYVTASAQGYSLQFSSNVNYGKAYLAYYMGKSVNVQDSTNIPASGKITFTGAAKLPGGIYTIVYGNNKFSSDFLLGKEQDLIITADTSDLGKTNIKGSIDNDIFSAYQNYVAGKGKELQQEKTAYENSLTKADSAKHEARYSALNVELNNYRKDIIDNKPGSMMAGLLQAMKGGPYPSKNPVTTQDSIDNYNFYKQYYWEGFDFNNGSLVRTPFFLPRLEQYYRQVLSQGQTDTLIKDIDYRLVLARSSPEMYKFLLNWYTDEYINPKYMGQDAVYVHLYEKYHSQGLTPWLNDKQMKIITDRAYMQMSNLIGKQAENIQMLDVQDRPVNLYDLKADYTLLLFWDPTCGHCKQEIPVIDSLYRDHWKRDGVQIFAVLTEDVHPAWVNYIKENKLQDWVHAYQTKAMAEAEDRAQKPGFRQLFDVTMTPTMLLLDKEKRIIAKKLGWQQINELLAVKTAKKTGS